MMACPNVKENLVWWRRILPEDRSQTYMSTGSRNRSPEVTTMPRQATCIFASRWPMLQTATAARICAIP